MYYKRLLYGKIKEKIEDKRTIILTGMRRVGKTTLLKKIFEEIESDNKICFDFENPLDIKYFEDIDYNDILINIINKGDLNKNKKIYIFIDEVQLYPGISKIVKYLSDHYEIKFILTGSSSYYLKNLFPESLSGRKIIFEMFPLNFEEFLIFKGENLKKYFNIKKKKKINELDYEIYDKLYEEYIDWGGFPEVVLNKTQEEKEERLNDIFSSYFRNEILNLADFSKNNKIRDLILLLSTRVGSQLDIVKLSQELKISRTTVYSYLSFLQATYFIHLISPYSKSVDREVSGTQKLYFCDNGILSIMAKLNFGQIFENTIYNQLKFKGKINYYRKRSGAEIDFILNEKEALEVKLTATISDIKKLKKTALNLKMKKRKIISKNYIENNEDVIFGQFL